MKQIPEKVAENLKKSSVRFFSPLFATVSRVGDEAPALGIHHKVQDFDRHLTKQVGDVLRPFMSE